MELFLCRNHVVKHLKILQHIREELFVVVVVFLHLNVIFFKVLKESFKVKLFCYLLPI